MNACVLFINSPESGARLRDVASTVFSSLGVVEWEERHSSNYPPDEHYFAGYCENAEVIVSDGDDERTSDYPFHVSIDRPGWRKGPGIIATDVQTLAKALVASGFVVFVPTGDWTRADWDGAGDKRAG
jgi:hypothetical protein